MNRTLLAIALLCACRQPSEGEFPIMPGGSGFGSAGGLDAPPANVGDAGNELAGRVCLLSDSRRPKVCATSGAGDLTVTLGNAIATTAADGAFVIKRSTDQNLVWTVSGTGIVTTTMRLRNGTTIPVISTDLYGVMVASVEAITDIQDGAIIAQVSHGGLPLANAVAVASPAPDSVIVYDGPSVTEWSFDTTGPLGIVWIPAIKPSNASLSINNGTVQGTISNIPVVAGTITFELAEIP